MKRMLSILALLGAFLLMPFVAQAQQMCPITVEQPQNGKLEVFKGTKPFGQRADYETHPERWLQDRPLGSQW